jgi:hypothetical protein
MNATQRFKKSQEINIKESHNKPKNLTRKICEKNKKAAIAATKEILRKTAILR